MMPSIKSDLILLGAVLYRHDFKIKFNYINIFFIHTASKVKPEHLL